jgi:flagellar hook-associated protein 3 FlgL
MGGWASIYSTTQAALENQTAQLSRLQEMAASGSRIIRASDSPTDAGTVLALRSQSASLQAYMQNIASTSDTLQVATTAMQSISTDLSRVRELVTQAASGTYTAEDRVPIAGEINSLLEEILSTANTDHLGQYVFAGDQANAPAYTAQYKNGSITSVQYVGGDHDMPVPVAAGVQQSGVLVGSDIFANHSRATPVFGGSTGAKAGAGTSTVVGDAWLTAQHAATTYSGASGIVPGSSSPGHDTVLGNGHTLTIDAVAKTIQLDDAAAVSFDGQEGQTDFKVAGANGAAVFVNLSGLAAGFQGTVAMQATGTLSIDDGQSSVPIDFSGADNAVTDSATGRVLYVDGSGISQTGVEPVQNPGTYDLFNSLIAVRDAILNGDNLSTADMLKHLNLAGSALQEASGSLTQALTTSGARIQAMSSLKTNLDDFKTYADQQSDSLSTADIAQLSLELARYQTLYSMTLASSSKLLSLSLLDYLS